MFKLPRFLRKKHKICIVCNGWIRQGDKYGTIPLGKDNKNFVVHAFPCAQVALKAGEEVKSGGVA